MRQRRQHIRVTILPPNIFSTEVALGPGGSSGGESELDCLSFWQILVPVFSSSCSLARGAKGFRPHARVTHVYTRAGGGTGNTLARVLRTSTHAIYLNLHKAHKPATKSCARAPRSLMRKHTRAHSGKHSVHTHTYPPRSCFTSALPERAPTHSPVPIFSKPSTSAGPQPSFQEETALPRGTGLPRSTLCRRGAPSRARPRLPYRSSRYFRYSEQSCWVPGLNQGVQDAERKFSGEMAGRCNQSGRETSQELGGHSPISSTACGA